MSLVKLMAAFKPVILGAVLIQGLALPQSASAQRKIDEYGAGNCIFAPQALPFNKEKSKAYKTVKTQFGPHEDVYTRCYFNGKLNSQKKYGKLYNSLRDDGYYYATVFWRKPSEIKGGKRFYQIRRIRHSLGNSGSWDQQSYQFTKAKGCDLYVEKKNIGKLGAEQNGCVDFGNLAKALGRERNIDLPYNAEICMEVHTIIANKYRTKRSGNSVVTEPLKFNRKIAGGCFRVNSAP